MTAQEFARAKLKAYTEGRRAVFEDRKPALPDGDFDVHQLEVLHNALQEGLLIGLRDLEAAKRSIL